MPRNGNGKNGNGKKNNRVVVEKKGNSEANLPTELVKMVIDVNGLFEKFGDFSDKELLALGKDKKIKTVREKYQDAISLCKFMEGKEITQDAYDRIKKYIRESYKVEFWVDKVIKLDRKTGLDVEVEIPKAQNINALQMKDKASVGTLDEETRKEYEWFNTDNKSKLEAAQSGKAMITAQVKAAQSLAHRRQADEMNVKRLSLKAIWMKATGEKEFENKDFYPVENSEEKEILVSFPTHNN